MERRKLNYELKYGKYLIGNIQNAFCGEEATGTWFGEFILTADNTEKEILDFISFCKNWHERMDLGEDPEVSEFDKFRDILENDSWNIKAPDDSITMIGCPVFYQNEITWTSKPHK